MKLVAALQLSLAILALAPALLRGSTLEGRVALPKSHPAPVVNQRYEIVSNAGVLATNPPVAIVYLEGDFPLAESPPVQQMGQKDLMFLQTLLPVQVGTRVEFPNLDPTYHNIFSFSPSKRFDLGRYRSDERPVPSVVFDKPGLVTLRCDIHEHMRALILVLATPYFAVTDTEGRFRLEGLPAGRFVAKAWIDSRTTRSQPVDLRPDRTVRVDFP